MLPVSWFYWHWPAYRDPYFSAPAQVMEQKSNPIHICPEFIQKSYKSQIYSGKYYLVVDNGLYANKTSN